jgi:CDP-diacylglycerol--serine O-phosphatidyltransferase
MKETVKNLPNLLTLGNLACGAIGIERLFANDLYTVVILMGIAAVLDFADGFTARLLKADGEMGKQLDSLADLVTFTLLPGLVMFHYTLKLGYCMPNGFCTSRYAWLALPLAGAWRLAKFNIDTRQTTGFIGVPTPITGLAFGTLILGFESGVQNEFSNLFHHPYFFSFAPIVAAYLMVSDYPMLSFKFKPNDPLRLWKWSLPVLAILFVLLFKAFAGIPFLAVYVLLSIIANFVTKSSNG